MNKNIKQKLITFPTAHHPLLDLAEKVVQEHQGTFSGLVRKALAQYLEYKKQDDNEIHAKKRRRTFMDAKTPEQFRREYKEHMKKFKDYSERIKKEDPWEEKREG